MITIPAEPTSAALSVWIRAGGYKTTTTADETLKARLISASNAVLTTLATYSNFDGGSIYVQHTLGVTAYEVQEVCAYFEGI